MCNGSWVCAKVLVCVRVQGFSGVCAKFSLWERERREGGDLNAVQVKSAVTMSCSYWLIGQAEQMNCVGTDGSRRRVSRFLCPT